MAARLQRMAYRLIARNERVPKGWEYVGSTPSGNRMIRQVCAG